LATIKEVNGKLNQAKNVIQEKWGSWAIVRLADGASISGSGYQWTIMEDDPRPLGGKLCYGKFFSFFFPIRIDAVFLDGSKLL